MSLEDTRGDAPVRADQYVAPAVGRSAFHCPYCNVYAQQRSHRLLLERHGDVTFARLTRCGNCEADVLWWTSYASNPAGSVVDNEAIMVWPHTSANAPAPHVDMPDDVRRDYAEASSIVDRSPRGAAALLRLALQKLMVDLGEAGENINDDIGALVNKGLQVDVQQALDALRVIGNEAVHPGTLDLRDDIDTAASLFGLLNFIVDQRIAQPKKLQALYSKLPPAKLAGIQQRDNKSVP